MSDQEITIDTVNGEPRPSTYCSCGGVLGVSCTTSSSDNERIYALCCDLCNEGLSVTTARSSAGTRANRPNTRIAWSSPSIATTAKSDGYMASSDAGKRAEKEQRPRETGAFLFTKQKTLVYSGFCSVIIGIIQNKF